MNARTLLPTSFLALAHMTVLMICITHHSAIAAPLGQGERPVQEGSRTRAGTPAGSGRNDAEAKPEFSGSTARPETCEKGVESDRRAAELSPHDESVELRLARRLASCHQYTEAIARYRRVLELTSHAADLLAELAQVLLRDHRPGEAVAASRQLLQIDPGRLGRRLLLARALAAAGNYGEALLRYNEVLRATPENYDALEGKGYVLYWTRRYPEARASFEHLATVRPDDVQNQETLRSIRRAEEDARLAVSPGPRASPEDFIAYFRQRLAAYPNDRQALKGLAENRARVHDFQGAIGDYETMLRLYPDDRDSKVALAGLLATTGQYQPALSLYRDLLAGAPDDLEILESLARVNVWSRRTGEALAAYEKLLARRPSETAYEMQIARLQATLEHYPAARQRLLPVLAADPQNREARLLLAQVDLKQGRHRSSLRQFRVVRRQDPRNFDAAFGEAQIAYYQDRLGRAATLASALVKDRPDSFDAIILLAAIERARRHEREALELLERANRISPDNPEVRSLRGKIRKESGIGVHTFASYTRETGRQEEIEPLSSEDLRTFSFGTTIEAATLPRTTSYFSLSYLPVSSPLGAIQGAAVPAEFLYRQTTRTGSFLTLRGGFGLVRFGPGTPQLLPGQPAPVPAAGIRPIGLAGISVSAGDGVRLDLNWSRSPIDYTPLSVRLGVIEDRFEGGVNFLLDSRTELRLTYYQAEYTSEKYLHTTFLDPQVITSNKPDRDRARGGEVLVDRNLLRREHFELHAGYSGTAYGFQGPRRQVFMGFFNPSFYQRHLLTARIRGILAGPLTYDFSAAFGLQQVGHAQAFQSATILNPAVTFKASSTLSFTLGYSYYNSGQALGVVRGNGVKLSSDLRF